MSLYEPKLYLWIFGIIKSSPSSRSSTWCPVPLSPKFSVINHNCCTCGMYISQRTVCSLHNSKLLTLNFTVYVTHCTRAPYRVVAPLGCINLFHPPTELVRENAGNILEVVNWTYYERQIGLSIIVYFCPHR